MRVLKEYKPLYFDDYMTADCFGGRAGARSHSITQHALHEVLHSTSPVRAFFLREVHATIHASMWQDFKDRIGEYEEEHDVDLSNYLEWTDNKNGENYCVNKITGWSITTKGFKVSSGNQTASLKSLAGATHVYIDEADEVAKSEFLKLKLSLRKKGANIKIVRAFNPPHKDHWIWGDFNLTKISHEELLGIVSNTSSIDKTTLKEIIARNNKTYFKATPIGDRHISISTNHLNNYLNLNKDAVSVYDEILLEDFHYYVITIIGLIPNDAGDIVYYEYDKNKYHSDRIVSQNDILHVGMDFNVTNMSAVVHVVDSEKTIAVAELTKIFDTHQMCAALADRFSGHKIIVYPDASGGNRSTSSGKSDIDIIKESKFQVISDNKNPPVRDRINTMNSKFRKGEYLVNRFTCPEYSESLTKLKYKGGEPDKSSGLDHITDAGGYFIHKQFNKPRKVKASFSY